MRKRKIPLDKVQGAFNAAIKRRDCRCMIHDDEPCSGSLECSHFHTVGGSPALRFYPPNAYAQCARHQWNHHNRKDSSNAYRQWLDAYHHGDSCYMQGKRKSYIRYTDSLKAEIIRLCSADMLDDLKTLIEDELGNDCHA